MKSCDSNNGAVKSDIYAAILFYKYINIHMAKDFVDELRATLEKIKVDSLESRSKANKVYAENLKTFPFTILYKCTKKKVSILAVMYKSPMVSEDANETSFVQSLTKELTSIFAI